MEEIRNKIIECLEGIGIFLDLSDNEDVNLCEYGMDSMGYIVFICEVETVFGISIPDEYLNIQNVVSLNGLTDIVFNLCGN
mgnify:FL=1